MRTVALLSAVIALLAVPAFGVINILLTADKTTILTGETTTVRMWGQGTQAGLFSASGDIVATGDVGTLTSVARVGRGWNPLFCPTFGLVPANDYAGVNGGWSYLGSEQTNFLTPDSMFAKAAMVDLFDYTVRGEHSGSVTLAVVPGTHSGYKFAETDKTMVLGTNTPVTIQVSDVTLMVLGVSPSTGLAVSGWQGGPFGGKSVTYTLTNASNRDSMNWIAGNTQPWVTLSKTGGTLPPLGTDSVVVSLTGATDAFPVGTYTDTVTFTNLTNGNGNTTRSVSLSIPDPTGDFDGDGHVDVIDLLIFIAAWNTHTDGANWNPVCDLNADRYVDGKDQQVFLQAYGAHPGDANWNAACDFNGNGAIDSGDYGILQQAEGSYAGDPNFNPACDLNGDGWVDVTDLLDFETTFGI